jgi:hypothetical protein
MGIVTAETDCRIIGEDDASIVRLAASGRSKSAAMRRRAYRPLSQRIRCPEQVSIWPQQKSATLWPGSNGVLRGMNAKVPNTTAKSSAKS